MTLDRATFNLALARTALQIALDPAVEKRGVLVDPQNVSPQIQEMRLLAKDDPRELYHNDPAMYECKRRPWR